MVFVIRRHEIECGRELKRVVPRPTVTGRKCQRLASRLAQQLTLEVY